MTKPGAPSATFLLRGASRASLLALALSIAAIASVAGAQNQGVEPNLPADLRAAIGQADKGSSAELVRLADLGRADAQYYAGVMFIFGRGSIAKAPARGCAYEEKASASRADAMHMVGECYRRGLFGKPDAEKAKAAFARAAQMGSVRSKCTLGDMLLAEPAEAPRGLALCKQAAEAGDVASQVRLAQIYFAGGPVKADHAEARRWYEKAANQQNPEAARKLGEMYANGDGGKRDAKKAVSLWQAAEKAGDPFSAILVADQLFSDLTGGKKPGPGKYAFKGGVPVGDVEVIEDWYQQALDHDPRPDVKKRAQLALSVLKSFKAAHK